MTDATPNPHPPAEPLPGAPVDVLQRAGLLPQIVTGLGDGVWDWDLEVDRVDYSLGFQRLLGYDRPEVFSAQFTFRSHLHPDDAVWVLPLVRQLLDGRSARFEATYRLRHAQGGFRWFLGRGVVIPASNGQPRHLVGLLSDVHQRTEAEQQRLLREQTQRQRLVQDALTDWCRHLAGGLKVLAAQPGADWMHLPDHLGVMAGNQPQRLEVLDVRDALSAAMAQARAQAPDTVRWGLEPLDRPLHILADPAQCQWMLGALCRNAWQALPGGVGFVHLSVQPDDDGQGVTLVVRDNGVGLSADVLVRVFEPFFTTRPAGQGWGLGLTVARRLAQSLQGRLTLRSEPGQGAEAHVWLPRVQGWAASPSRGEAADRPSRPVDRPTPSTDPSGVGVAPSPVQPPAVPRHVVYVDDYEAIAYLMSRMLMRRGYRVTAFERAADALAHLRDHADEVDLLVSDYNMPGLSGLDVVRQAKQLCPGLPAVLTSGHVTPAMAAEAESEGVLQVLNRQDSVEAQVDAIVRLLATLPPRRIPEA